MSEAPLNHYLQNKLSQEKAVQQHPEKWEIDGSHYVGKTVLKGKTIYNN